MADGKITVSTQIDNKGAEKGIEELSKIIKDGVNGLKGDLEKVSSSILKAFGVDFKDIIGNFKLVSDQAQNISGIMGTIENSTEAFKLGATITDVVQSWKDAKIALDAYGIAVEGGKISQEAASGALTAWEILVGLFTGKVKIATVVTQLWGKASSALSKAWRDNPVGVVLVVLSVLVKVIMHLWNTNEGFRNAVIAAWNAILEAGKAVWSWLVKFFTEEIPNAWNYVITLFGSAGEWFTELWANIKQAFIDGWNSIVIFFTESIPAWWEGVKQSFIDGWNNIVIFFTEGIPAWWESIKQFFIDGWNAIVSFFTETIPAWIEQIFNWFNELPYKIGEALGFLLGTIVQGWINIFNYFSENIPVWIGNIVTWFSELPGKIWTWLLETINNIVNWGVQTYNNMVTYVTNAINAIVAFFSGLPGKIWTWLVNVISNIVNWGAQLYNNMVTYVTNAINAIVTFFSELPGKIWTWLSGTISNVVKFGIDIFSKAKEAGSNIVTGIVDTITSLPEKIYSIGVNIVEGLWNGITSMGSWIADKVKGFFTGIVDGAKKALGIRSPSRVFRDQVGAMMAQGVGVGFEDEVKGIERSIDKRLSDMVSSFNVDEITARMTAAVYQEQAATSRAMTSSYDRITANNSTITNNNDNGLNFNIENFNNNRNQDIRALTEEIEFYRKQIEIGGGKA